PCTTSRLPAAGEKGAADVAVQLATPPKFDRLHEADPPACAVCQTISRVVAPQPPGGEIADAGQTPPSNHVAQAGQSPQARHQRTVTHPEGLPVPASECEVSDTHPDTPDQGNQKCDREQDQHRVKVNLTSNQKSDDKQLPAHRQGLPAIPGD